MNETERQSLALKKKAFDEAFFDMKQTVGALFPFGTRVSFYFAHRRQTGTIAQAPYVWHNPASIWIETDKTKRVRRIDPTNPEHRIAILP